MSYLRKLLLGLLLLCASSSAARPPADCDDPPQRQQIQTWLTNVEAFLRSRDVSSLSPSQRQRRAALLDHLRAYWQAGRFPHNHLSPELTPVFIDEHGTACAVGYLLIQGGAADLAHQIARDHLLARLPELDSPRLARWARDNGFTPEELALIQPSYTPEKTTYETCLSQPPTSLRYAFGGWRSVEAVRQASAFQDMEVTTSYPWFMSGPEGELLLITREGEPLGWTGGTFEYLDGKHPEAPFPLMTVMPNWWRPKVEFKSGPYSPAPGQRFFVASLGPEGFAPEIPSLTEKLHPELFALWQDRGTGTVFGVGRDGTLARRTPYESWVALTSPTQAPLLAIHGTGPMDLWAVGGGGVALHFDGTQWQRVETGTDEGLTAVAANAKNDVWAVGTRGTALHFDGTRWRRVDTGISSNLRSVAARGEEVWLGGDEGLILHREDGTWTKESTQLRASVTSFGFAGGSVFATTDAQEKCTLRFNASGYSDYAPNPNLRRSVALLPAGILQALVNYPQSNGLPLLAFVVPLNLVLFLLYWLWGRRAHREVRGALAVALVTFAGWQGFDLFISSNATTEFSLTSYSAGGTSGEIGRIQDWLLLEHDLKGAPGGDETKPLSEATWKTPQEFIRNTSAPGSARDRELRERYARLIATGATSPFAFLLEYEKQKNEQLKPFGINNTYD
jgi:hypothetical protein